MTIDTVISVCPPPPRKPRAGPSLNMYPIPGLPVGLPPPNKKQKQTGFFLLGLILGRKKMPSYDIPSDVYRYHFHLLSNVLYYIIIPETESSFVKTLFSKIFINRIQGTEDQHPLPLLHKHYIIVHQKHYINTFLQKAIVYTLYTGL